MLQYGSYFIKNPLLFWVGQICVGLDFTISIFSFFSDLNAILDYCIFFLHILTGVKKFLLYARRSEIRGVDIDNPYLNIITALTVPDIDDVTAMDYDAIDERIYWADVKTRTIKRAFINGTKLETVMSGGRLIIFDHL